MPGRDAPTKRALGKTRWFGISPHSLQFKATVLVVALTLCVTAAVTGYLLQSGVNLFASQQRAQFRQTAAMLAKAAALPCERTDRAALLRLAEETADGMPLLFVLVLDADGNELAAAQHRTFDQLDEVRKRQHDAKPVPGTPTLTKTGKRARTLLEIVYPILARSVDEDSKAGAEGELLGYLRVGVLANEWHRIMSSKLDLVIGIGTFATAAAILLGFLLIRRIVSPLEHLAGAMVEFSCGKLDVRSSVKRKDEIGKLAAAFNLMADQHQHTHDRIVRLNTELEQRVAERTRQLRELAARDSLTGVYNRRHFGEVLHRGFGEALRYDNDLSCMMIDLDSFKAVNDSLGHLTGDRVLVIAAESIRRELRSADVVARYGGDEFVVLLPQTDVDNAHVLADRITGRLAKRLADELPGVSVTMSVGIAGVRSVGAEDADSLVRGADRAMYEAKGAGKNRTVTASVESRPAPL